MKRIVLLFLIPFLYAYGQSTDIPVVHSSVPIYADSISQTIYLERSMFLGGFYVEKSRTSKLKFQVRNNSNSEWYNLIDEGSVYEVSVDSSVKSYVPVKPVLFYSVKTVRVLIDRDIADTLNLYFDKRKY
jgi:hypothetical protein